jgi:hypothetical protein
VVAFVRHYFSVPVGRSPWLFLAIANTHRA